MQLKISKLFDFACLRRIGDSNPEFLLNKFFRKRAEINFAKTREVLSKNAESLEVITKKLTRGQISLLCPQKS